MCEQNYDRLKVRVWDKEEKKMLYPGDIVQSLKLPENEIVLTELEFIGINGKELIFKRHQLELSIISIWLSDQDRFVPMQCWGLPDKNKKLIYDDDIVKFEDNLYLCSFSGFSFGLSSIKEACRVLAPLPFIRSKSEIIGNHWENPGLMEVKK